MKAQPKTARREHAFGDLYELLAANFPYLRTDRDAFNVQAFASLLDYSNETIYKALREFQPLKLGVALRILEASHQNQGAKPMYWPDLLPFTIPGYPAYMAPEAVSDLLD